MPTSNPSRRARIAAIAATADYNANEADNAQRMLERMPEHRLDAIAADIKAEYGRGIESQFVIGRLLSEARALFVPEGAMHGDDRAFGQWCIEQNLPFGRTTAYLLRVGYEREPEVRALLLTRVISGESDLGVTKAVRLMTAKPKPVSIPLAETTRVDPAYASLRDARNVILGWDGENDTHNAFASMHVDDLRESGRVLKALLDAYNAARTARG